MPASPKEPCSLLVVSLMAEGGGAAALSRAQSAIRRVVDKADAFDSGRILVVTGAGCSAEVSIPTTYGQSAAAAGSFVERLRRWLALAVFSTPLGWRLMPQRAWRLYWDLLYQPILRAEPHAGHEALRALEEWFHKRSKLKPGYNKSWFTVATTNVDSLHQKAGSTNVLELHGTTAKHRCVEQGHTIDEVALDATCPYPHCPGHPRPDCVLFTEHLPLEPWVKAQMAASKLQPHDVCLVVGAGATTFPAAYLPEIAWHNKAQVIEINVEPTRFTREFDPIFLQGGAREVLGQLLEPFSSSSSPDEWPSS